MSRLQTRLALVALCFVSVPYILIDAAAPFTNTPVAPNTVPQSPDAGGGPVQGAETGSITGHVKLSRVRGTPLPSNAYSTRAVGGVVAAARSSELQNVVVYLTGVTFRGVLPTSRRQIEQHGETFTPRVVAITRGSTVDFPNGDPFFHNVFSLSSAASFNLGRYPQGQSRSREFTKAGLVKVFCQIHSHMSASILVLDHPFFAIPETPDGTFTLRNVPAGAYKIVGWHERVGERASAIQVLAGGTATIDISLPVEDTR
jgi:plastocyanin